MYSTSNQWYSTSKKMLNQCALWYSNWNLVMFDFEESRKPGYTEMNLSLQKIGPSTNSTHIWRRRLDLNPGKRYMLRNEKRLTWKNLVLNGNNHKINSHQEVRQCKICQKATLNWVVFPPNHSPGDHRQITKHSKKTEQPYADSETLVMNHAIAAREGIFCFFRKLTCYFFKANIDVAT